MKRLESTYKELKRLRCHCKVLLSVSRLESTYKELKPASVAPTARSWGCLESTYKELKPIQLDEIDSLIFQV